MATLLAHQRLNIKKLSLLFNPDSFSVRFTLNDGITLLTSGAPGVGTTSGSLTTSTGAFTTTLTRIEIVCRVSAGVGRFFAQVS